MDVYIVIWETVPDDYQVAGVYPTESMAYSRINKIIEKFQDGRYDHWDFRVVKEFVQINY